MSENKPIHTILWSTDYPYKEKPPVDRLRNIAAIKKAGNRTEIVYDPSTLEAGATIQDYDLAGIVEQIEKTGLTARIKEGGASISHHPDLMEIGGLCIEVDGGIYETCAALKQTDLFEVVSGTKIEMPEDIPTSEILYMYEDGGPPAITHEQLDAMDDQPRQAALRRNEQRLKR